MQKLGSPMTIHVEMRGPRSIAVTVVLLQANIGAVAMFLYLFVYDVAAYSYVGNYCSMRLLKANCSTSKDYRTNYISSDFKAYHCLFLTCQCADRVLS